MKHDTNSELSRLGCIRREAMRAQLCRAMVRHHVQNVRRRRMMAASALAIALSASITFVTSSRLGTSGPLAPAPAPAARSWTRIIHTPPDITDRYAFPPSPRVVVLSDEDLLAELSSLGRPTGLIRQDGRTRLSEPVMDVTITAPSEPASPSL